MEEEKTIQGRGRWRRVAVVLAVCVLVGIGVVAFWPGEREPEYNGKKLSEWLAIIVTNNSAEVSFDTETGIFREAQFAGAQASIGAVRAIGTNAFPWLLKRVSRDQTGRADTILSGYAKFPRFLQREGLDAIVLWLIRKAQPMQIDRGNIIGFAILRRQGGPAVPKLILILRNSKSRRCQLEALYCLGMLGETARPALPYLEELVRADSKNDVLGPWAISTIKEIERNSAVGTNGVKDF